MKKFIFITILFSHFFIFSCVSSNIIPGQEAATNQNIYYEYLNIADTYYSLQKYDKALTYYQNCLRNKTLYNDAYYKIGLCYVMKKDWPQAHKIFNDILEKDPENQTIQSSLAYIYSMEGKYDLAENLYSELVSKQPQNSQFLENYIAILLKQQKYDLVKENLAVLKEIAPESKKITVISEQLEKAEINSDSSN